MRYKLDVIMNELGYKLKETDHYFSLMRYVYIDKDNSQMEFKYNGEDLIGIGKLNNKNEPLLMTPQELSILGVLVKEGLI